MEKQATIGIVIPTFNRKESLRSLLLQIMNQTESFNLSTQTVVVVDGSNDGTLEMLAQDFSTVSVVEGTGTWWFTKSLNEGCNYLLESYSTDYILTLNDDVILSDSYLKTMFAEISNEKENIVLGAISIDFETKGKVTFAGTELKRKWTGSLVPRIRYGTPYVECVSNDKTETLVLPTRGLLFSSSLYKVIEGFDESFPQYASDHDFVLRARKKGYKAYITAACQIYEKTLLTGAGSPRTTKKVSVFVKNALLNKYSPSYLLNSFRMSWRHKNKLLFPLYVLFSIIGIYKSFFKYK